MNRVVDAMPHYRGEQKFGWDITPGIFRPPFAPQTPQDGKALETKAIAEFERIIHQHIGNKALRSIYNGFKYGREWDLLFQAQHAGIKTTLTDWSAFISSALYFATEESSIADIENSDAQVWCLMAPTDKIMGDRIYTYDPSMIDQTFLINPASYLTDIETRIFEYRMYHQKGRFIIPASGTCDMPLNLQDEIKDFLVRLTIPADSKKAIRDELTTRRVTRSYFYVDENPAMQDLISAVNDTVFQVTS